nr:PREDICTED: protein FAR1-RELATED SEQUENCE 5-like [Daucus carota subsp. sativus]
MEISSNQTVFCSNQAQFSSNQANFREVADIQSSSGNSVCIDVVDNVCDTTVHDFVEDCLEGFDESISRSSKVWNPKVSDDKLKPYPGQLFKDIESAFKFYTDYGRDGGFEVRKSTQKVRNGIIVTKYIICSKGGHHDTSMTKDVDVNSESSHASTSVQLQVKRRKTVTKRCDCRAKIILKYNGFNAYVISSFIEVHNHRLASPSGKEFLLCNRSMTSFQRRFVLDAAKSNIGSYRAHNLFKSISGSYSEVGATAVDFQNWMRDIKLYIGKHDSDMLIQKFQNKRDVSDGGFFFEYQTDSNGHLTRLFWADIQGRRSYEVFGDVVSFDATYRTNKYGMVFVPFIGVDNHWKSVTFASALLNHEDATNFTWACEMFLQAFGRPPKCIITDQCLGMKVAIANTFPHSIHRYCMWHIMQKFPAKVGPVFCAETGFMEKLNKFVWSSHLTVPEFEKGWDDVLKEFGLSEHVWLKEIYAMRESWIPAFFADKPMGALLRTTSRSESSNFYFNHFVQKGDTLSEFYLCYESAIDKQIHDQNKLNTTDKNCIPQSITEKAIEKHAACLYTRSMFYKVQKQIKASCFHISLGGQPIVTDGVNKYLLCDKSLNGKLFEVEFCLSTYDISCSCKLFTRVGYLCRHCFYCLSLWGVDKIPHQFICKRWMRNAERFCKLKFTDESECATDGYISREIAMRIWTEYQACVDNVCNNLKGLEYLLDEMKCLRIRVEEKFDKRPATKDDMLEEIFGVRPSGSSNVLPPLPSNNKGCRKRIVGGAELSRDGKKRPTRTCKFCHTLGYHDSRNCPKKLLVNQQIPTIPNIQVSLSPSFYSQNMTS